MKILGPIQTLWWKKCATLPFLPNTKATSNAAHIFLRVDTEVRQIHWHVSFSTTFKKSYVMALVVFPNDPRCFLGFKGFSGSCQILHFSPVYPEFYGPVNVSFLYLQSECCSSQWYFRQYCASTSVATVWRGPFPVSTWHCLRGQKPSSIKKLFFPVWCGRTSLTLTSTRANTFGMNRAPTASQNITLSPNISGRPH